jgi:type II secretory pathway pseudopilin PulG
MRRALRKAGFTILEILIAIVILVLGISGIIALFPTAIESGNQTVQDSYAAQITQSVVDGIAVGIRESRYRVEDSSNPKRVWNYFIFDHDGVYDAMVPSPQAYATDPTISMADWCILMPLGKEPNQSAADEPWYVYPSCPNRAIEVGDGTAVALPQPYDNHTQQNLANLQSSPATADDWGLQMIKPCWDGKTRLWIRRVYMLGRYRQNQAPSGFPARAVREEFLGDPEGILAPTGPNYDKRPRVDPYEQYSYAFALRRAKIDNASDPSSPMKGGPDGIIDAFDKYSSSLYEVHIFVFRNFDGKQDTHAQIGAGQRVIPRTNVWIKEFVTLMSL